MSVFNGKPCTELNNRIRGGNKWNTYQMCASLRSSRCFFSFTMVLMAHDLQTDLCKIHRYPYWLWIWLKVVECALTCLPWQIARTWEVWGWKKQFTDNIIDNICWSLSQSRYHHMFIFRISELLYRNSYTWSSSFLPMRRPQIRIITFASIFIIVYCHDKQIGKWRMRMLQKAQTQYN